MRLADLGGALLILFVSVQAGATMSFKEWKSQKFNEAAQRLNQTQLEIAKTSKNSNSYKDLTDRLSQEKWNLEVAHDLRVADYFELYLLAEKSPQKFQEAAQKMSPEEVAELMGFYARGTSQNITSNPNVDPKEEILSQGSSFSNLQKGRSAQEIK